YASAAAPAAVAQAASPAPAATVRPSQQPHYETIGPAAIAAEPLPAAQTMARPALKPEAPSRPVTAPTAETDGPFIAPRPVEAGLPPAQPAPPATRPDPFAEAAYTNAGRPQPSRAAAPAAPAPKPEKAEKPRMPSLFERVTGAAARRVKPAAAEPRPAEPTLGAPAAAPASPQPSLGQVDPSERLAASQPGDDLLDIPAFLRRQAN